MFYYLFFFLIFYYFFNFLFAFISVLPRLQFLTCFSHLISPLSLPLPLHSPSAMVGKLIVIEGLDRCGKTTQISKLIQHLTHQQISSIQFKFPDRSTPIGKLINDYLSNPKCTLEDHVIHLLFSANRWELSKQIQDSLQKYQVVLLDRYWYSGVAYSTAKGLDLEWCKWADRGLPQPDLVLFFDLDPTLSQHRPEFGEERYERTEFQQAVRNAFVQLYDHSTWKTIDASQSIDQVSKSINDTLAKFLSIQ